jgi:hypothetical protein
MSKKVQKPVKKQVSKAPSKAKAWSDRYIFDHIPAYQGEELPKRNLSIDTVTIIVEKDPVKVKGKRGAAPAEAVITTQSLEELMLRLEELWAQNDIPEAQRGPFRDCVKSMEEEPAKDLVIKEILDFEKNKANVQLALRSVAAREESLKSLKEMQNFLQNSPDWEKVKEVQLEAAELLHAHRMLTLNCVESIVKWRNQLSNAVHLSPFNFPFMWEGVNYLLNLKDDLDFLKASEYAKVLYFGEEPDPFLVYPSVPSGKLEKSRKRDPNYFVNDGQVIVPLPSTITGRVKEAEEILRKEWDWVKKIEDNDPKRLASLFGKEIRDDIVNQVVNEFLKELEDDLKNQKKLDEERRKLEADNEKLSKMIYDDLFNSLTSDLFQLAENEYLTEKALKDSESKKQQTENDRLARLVYKSLKDGLIEDNLKSLADQILREMQDEEDEENSVMERGNIIEELGLDFAGAEAFNELGGMRWVPIGISEDLIQEALSEYYRFIPSVNKEAVPNIDTLMLEVTKYSNTRWYWAIKNNYIFALLIFSVDCFNKTGRKLIVHHLSSLYWKAFPAIIESATQHLWKIDPCDEARICMFSVNGQDLSPDIKKVMNQTKYRWKAGDNMQEGSFNITIFGRFKTKEDESPAFMPFSLKSFNILHASESPTPCNNEMTEEMMQVSNRPVFLNSLLALIGRLEKASIKITTKSANALQAELSVILENMNRTQSFSFPNLKSLITSNQVELEEFSRSNKIPVMPMLATRVSVSELELKFRWIHCTNVVETIRGEQFMYMRFRSKAVTVVDVEDTQIITVPTEMPNITAFFISSKMIKHEVEEHIYKKLDLFYVTERLLMKGSPSDVHEVWVPSFRKSAKFPLLWAEGYEIVPQTDEKVSSFIVKSFEECKLEMQHNVLSEGMLVVGKKQGPVLMNSFIFGLKYTKGDKILDIPLFSCMVQPKDWIKA